MKTDCGMLIKQISDHIAKDANNALRGDDLTLSQLRCLEYLYGCRQEQVPLKQLESHFRIAQPTVAGIVSRLGKKGLVQTQASPVNQRAKTVCLTPAGEALFQKVEQHRLQMEQVLLSSLSPQEQAQFETLLQKVYNGIQGK